MRHSGPRGIPTGGKEQLKIIKANATKESRLTTREDTALRKKEQHTQRPVWMECYIHTRGARPVRWGRVCRKKSQKSTSEF